MKTLVMGAAMATTLLVATACGGGNGGGDNGAAGGGGGEESGGDGVLIFSAALASPTLDPDMLAVPQLALYVVTAYDTLTHVNPDETVEPLLAESFEAGDDDNGPYLELALRQGLTFADGTPFTSKTVELNIQRSAEREGSMNAYIVRPVTVEVIDEHTVRLYHPDGVGHLPRMLAGPVGVMISDKAIEEDADLSQTSYGIGAYTVSSFEPNRVVYTKTDDYWDPDAQASDSVEIIYMADDAKLNAVRANEVDVTILPPAMIKAGEDAGYEILPMIGSENYTFNYNTEMAPFDDQRVREALSLALDRQAICDGLLSGHCEANGQFFGAGTNAYDPDLGLSQAPFDMDRAQQLIEEAGASGAKVELVTVAGNQVFQQLAEVVQQQWNEAGLDVTVSPLPPPQVVGRFAIEKNVPMAFGATGNAYDPWDSVARYALVGGAYNPGNNENAEVAEAARQAMLETDQEKRMDIYREMNQTYFDAPNLVPILTPETNFAVAPHVEGWENPWAPSFPTLRGVKG